MRKLLKMSKDEAKRISCSSQPRFVLGGVEDGREWPFEPLETFSKRQKFWEWMVKCLRKKDGEKGPFSHLADQVTKYDVFSLYDAILNSVDLQNPFIFWERFEKFVLAKPEEGEDIFTYFTRIDKMATLLS